MPEKMRVLGGEIFLQIIAVSTVRNSMGGALEKRVGHRGGCVWCQLENGTHF